MALSTTLSDHVGTYPCLNPQFPALIEFLFEVGMKEAVVVAMIEMSEVLRVEEEALCL